MLVKHLGTSAEGFWVNANFLREVRCMKDIQSVKSTYLILKSELMLILKATPYLPSRVW